MLFGIFALLIALLALKLGPLSKATVTVTGYENTTITETNSTITNTSTTETNSINLSVSMQQSTSSPNIKNVVSTVFYKVLDVGRQFVYMLMSWIQGSSTFETIVNGGLLALAFFVLGYVAVVFAKIARLILYALSIVVVVLTVLMVIGW